MNCEILFRFIFFPSFPRCRESPQCHPQNLNRRSITNIRKSFAASALLVFFSFSAFSDKKPWSFPVESVQDAVFNLELPLIHNPSDTSGRGGTAFVIEIENKFYFVTNFHVIETFLLGITDLKITNRTGKIFKEEDIEGIAGLSFLYDLALIRIKPTRYEGPVLKHFDKYTIEENAYSLGFPNKQFQQVELSELSEVSSWHISGIKNNTSFSGGGSGSPVFSNKGEVIGVVRAGSKYELEFIRFNLIKEMLESKKKPHKNLKEWWEEEMRTVIGMSDKGDPSAQFVLAEYKARFFNTTQDEKYIKEALLLYEKAAVQGYFKSQMNLGLLAVQLAEGRKEESFHELLEHGKKWLRIAKKQEKHILTDLSLAIALTDERNSNEDFAEGWNILKKLSDKGIKPAQEHLKQIQAAYVERFPENELMETTEKRDGGCTNRLFR